MSFSGMRTLALVLLASSVSTSGLVAAAESPAELLAKSRRIVFLGDSITAAGQYVAAFEAWLLTQPLRPSPLVINAGLPSETVSGLSEDGHAGGKFPRPDLAERLERVLKATRPDLVIACYGINCGIYLPFDEERFARYRAGIQHLHTQVERTGAQLILMTPPFYDDARAKHSFSYNAVLDRYSDWLLEQRSAGWRVVDLHGPMTRTVAERRLREPEFTFQPDAVHPNAEGQWFVARQLILWFGDAAASSANSPEEMLQARQISREALPLLMQRMTLLRNAYVSAAGHQRPGVAAGLPIPEAERKAEELTRQIQMLPGVSQRAKPSHDSRWASVSQVESFRGAIPAVDR